jgi:hypothetical protein
LRVDVDIIEDVGNKSILLAKFRPIIEEVTALLEGQSEITNNIGQSCEIVALGSKMPNAIIFKARISSLDNGFNGVEV